MTRRLALALPLLLIGCRKHVQAVTWNWAFDGRDWQYSRSAGGSALLYAVVEPSSQYPGLWSAFAWGANAKGGLIVLTVPLSEAKARTERKYRGQR